MADYGKNDGLNEMQRRAVQKTDGPLLILAGAGSGKTTVLIHRVEHMINSGIRPWNILAITFTNKAAGELKDRLENALGERGRDVNASTFHSLCAKILRRDIAPRGYTGSFTIYDTDDSMRVVKHAIEELGIDEKLLPARAVLTAISRAKDKLQGPGEMLEEAGDDFRAENISRVYGVYAKRLKAANALDFDDLLVETVRLFQQCPDVLEYYRNRFKYIMVDEYQDTNHAQYLLVSLLAEKHQNLCVVGDDDQSIYKFRGATIENIMSFERQFPAAEVIRLEQNYRSTQNILSAANRVIENNQNRKGKNLWTDSGSGEKLLFVRAADETEESRVIAENVLEHIRVGAKYSDHAVLYRMNAQANSVERSLAKSGIPYRVVGGTRFFDHKEIRDVVAYLNVINNPGDDLRLLRIINEPRRGIGSSTLASAQELAAAFGTPLFEIIESPGDYVAISKKAGPLNAFTEIIRQLGKIAEAEPPDRLFDELMRLTGYIKSLEAQGFEGIGRIENVMEFKSIIVQYMQDSAEPSLEGFLEEIALYADVDGYDSAADNVTLMTIHSAKGLEFRYVYIAGMDEGIFPGRMATSNDAELEEERRLAYVAITRAKERLMLVGAERRLIFGQTVFSRPSRFISEIPGELIEIKSTARPKPERRERVVVQPGTPSSRTIGIGYGAGASNPVAASGESFAAGDKVLHGTFGEGTVLSAKPMAADTLLEIAFEGPGIKKIMANFARLTRKK